MKKWIAYLAVMILVIAGCQKKSSDENPDEGGKSSASTSAVVDSSAQGDEYDEQAERSIFKTKARSVIGDVHMLKGGVGDTWKQIRIGNWVVEDDRVQTRIESEAKLDALDGSTLIISENSDVTLKASEDSAGSKLYLVSVGNGKVYFDIQKQRNASYQFKTSSAGAAIRGTAGFVGDVKGNTVVSLKQGLVDVTGKTGKVSKIVQKQTILVDLKGKSSKLNLKSSGTKQLAKAIDSLAAISEVTAASLQKSLKTFDELYAARLNVFKSKVNFVSQKLDSVITEPRVKLRAFVDSGVVVTVWGESDTIGADGVYQREFTWGRSAAGVKRFLVSCSDGFVEYICDSTLVTRYQPPMDSGDADLLELPMIQRLEVDLGGNSERVHLPPPTGRVTKNLRISLKGITKKDLSELSSITVKRGGKIIRSYNENQLTALSYTIPLIIGPYNTVGRGIVAKDVEIEVVAVTKSGKEFASHKTYHAFCNRGNHDPETYEMASPEGEEYDDALPYFEKE